MPLLLENQCHTAQVLTKLLLLQVVDGLVLLTKHVPKECILKEMLPHINGTVLQTLMLLTLQQHQHAKEVHVLVQLHLQQPAKDLTVVQQQQQTLHQHAQEHPAVQQLMIQHLMMNTVVMKMIPLLILEVMQMNNKP